MSRASQTLDILVVTLIFSLESPFMELAPLVVAGLIGFFLWLQLRLYVSAKRREGRDAPPFDDLLPPGVSPSQRLLFYFFSEYCGPCRVTTPLIERLAATRPGIIKVDVAACPEVAHRFGVAATPTFVIVAGGKIERVVLGKVNERRILDLMGEGA